MKQLRLFAFAALLVVVMFLVPAPLRMQASPLSPDLALTALSFQYFMNDGGNGSGFYYLADGGTFVDDVGTAGIWNFNPDTNRYFLYYNTGANCGALSLGTYDPVSTQVRGIRSCTDGSGVLGVWFGRLLPAEPTTRVSIPAPAIQGNNHARVPSFAADGRYVAFFSWASNLVNFDTNGYTDIFVYDRVRGLISLVSVNSDEIQANGASFDPVMSTDGQFVAFESGANNLVSGDTNGYQDIFVRDRQSGTTSRVSIASDGTQANHTSHDTAISADGRYVAFMSLATNLVAGDTNGVYDAFVHDRLAGQTIRVSVASDGAQGDAPAQEVAISADGHFVAFSSAANNLVVGDTNDDYDIFVRDQETGQTTLVSVALNGTPAGGSYQPALSADGRYVAFLSAAANLVSGDTNGYVDIFVRDRQTGQTSRVSVATNGTQANNASYHPAISAAGQYVTFDSDASNLVGGDANGAGDVFIHDRQTGQTSRVSVTTFGVGGNAYAGWPAVSADGRYVAYWSAATNLVSGDTNGFDDVFVRDRQTGQTSRVSTGGTEADQISRIAVISADGRYVAFTSDAGNLVNGDTNDETDIFVYDRQTRQISRVSVASDGAQANGISQLPAISADGRYVAFVSAASNLVIGDTNWFDVFVHDRQTGQTTLVSVASDGTQANDLSTATAISGDGRYVAFESKASNLVPNDTNGWDDIFVHDRQTGQTVRVSVASDGTQANGNSEKPAISADGRYVAFQSWATNLVDNDNNGIGDVFVHDRLTGETTRVSVASDGTEANSLVYAPAISGNGQLVAFNTDASNLVDNDTNNKVDVYVHDRQTGQTSRISVTSDGAEGDDHSHEPALSFDGRYVAFQSNATNLIDNDTNGVYDVFVHDRQTGQTIRVSLTYGGTEANGDSVLSSISADGRYVAFTSFASNLVRGDFNGYFDIFVRDRGE